MQALLEEVEGLSGPERDEKLEVAVIGYDLRRNLLPPDLPDSDDLGDAATDRSEVAGLAGLDPAEV